MSKSKQGSWLTEIAESRKTRKDYDQKRFTYDKPVASAQEAATAVTKFNDPRGAGKSKPDTHVKNLNNTIDHGATRAELKKLANKRSKKS